MCCVRPYVLLSWHRCESAELKANFPVSVLMKAIVLTEPEGLGWITAGRLYLMSLCFRCPIIHGALLALSRAEGWLESPNSTPCTDHWSYYIHKQPSHSLNLIKFIRGSQPPSPLPPNTNIKNHLLCSNSLGIYAHPQEPAPQFGTHCLNWVFVSYVHGG